MANGSTLSVFVQKCVVNQLKLVEIGFVVINYNYAFCVWGLWQSVTDYMSDMGVRSTITALQNSLTLLIANSSVI